MRARDCRGPAGPAPARAVMAALLLAALAGGDGQRLDERVQAHEADGEPDAAQDGREHREERRVVGLGGADGL